MPADTFLLCFFLLFVFLVRGNQNDYQKYVVLPDQQTLQSHPVIRNATLEDVTAIVDILLDAFGPAPETRYIYQFRDQNPSYHRQCMKQIAQRILKQQPEDTIVHLIDAPVAKGSHETKAVSLAVWNLGCQKTPSSMSLLELVQRHCSRHLDLNITRALHWEEEFMPYKRRYIDKAYGSQVYLNGLATHPDFDGRGFAAAQVEWGKNLARRRGENVTLIATPAGYQLYRTIGFEEIANLTFTKVGGEFLTWFEVMVNTK